MMIRLLFTVWTWFILAVVAILGCILLLPLAIITAPFDRKKLYPGTFFRRMSRVVAMLAPMWRFEVSGAYPRTLIGPHVIVSNHASQLDCFCISYLPWEMKWLAKRSLFLIPFVGWAMALAGDVSIVRNKGTSVSVALRRCRQVLDQGMNVFIFPEGTRAEGTQLLPFKDGAFRLALEAGCPVLPLGVWGTREGLAKHAWQFNWCRGRVKVGRAISSREVLARHSHADKVQWLAAIAELKALAHTQIVELTAELRRELSEK